MEEASEWDIFKRVEKLEAIEPTLRDTYGIAVTAFVVFFVHSALAHNNPRKLKDSLVYSLEQVVSPETLKGLEKKLMLICELIEKER